MRHWHIDFLRAVAQVRGFAYAPAAGRVGACPPAGQPSLDCRWAQRLAELPEACLPAPGFGASDCRSGCRAHLVVLPPGAGVAGLATATLGQRSLTFFFYSILG